MKICVLLLLAVTASCSGLYLRDDLDSDVGSGGVLTIEFKKSLGLICDNENGEMIAKVGCGDSGSYKSVSADALEFEDIPEFSMLLTCNGNEGSLSECKHEEPRQLSMCSMFVGCESGRRSMRSGVV